MKKLKKTLLKDYNYELKNYIYAKRLSPYLKHIIFIAVILFLVACALIFIEQYIGVVVVFLIFALSLLVINKWINDCYIVTEAYLIHYDSSRKYYVIDYERVEDVTLKNNIALSFIFENRKHKIIFDKYDQDLKFLITIFEAKGFIKFEGEYLERPIEIKISDNKVTIIELDEIETPTQRLVGSLYDNYESVTPGFLNYILLRNSIIQEAVIVDGSLHVKIDKLDVKVDHPENISHEAVQAQDCIVVFEDVKSIKCFQKPNNVRGAKNKLLYENIEDIPRILYLAVISDSFIEDEENNKVFRLISSQGVLTNTLVIEYKEVIVGWKDLGGQSWFEDDIKSM